MTILPTAAPFPAPSFSFPEPASTSDPLFGVNPYSTTNLYLDQPQPSSLALPNLASRNSSRIALMQQAQLAIVQQAGVPLDSNPNEWTPDQAATQTDQALAKIATVNPELAQQLAAQRGGGEDSGGGFFDAIKDAVGTVLSPAISAFGTVLDYVGRTANLVPNIAFDLADGGDFNIGDDIGGALSGNMRHNWNSVFQELGWEGGGLGGFIRATIGLAGDIASDPLTWIIPTGAGMHTAEAGLLAGKKVATRAPTFLEMGRDTFGAAAGAAEAGLDNLLEVVTKGVQKEGLKYGDDVAERAQAVVGKYVVDGQRTLAADMLDAIDQLYTIINTKSLRTWMKNGGKLELSSGRVIEGAEAKQLMEAVVASGKGAARGSAEWGSARAFAQVMGGTRLKVAVPFSQFRYISPAIPKTWGFTLDNMGRFFAGQSGMNRMVGAIASGQEGASWESLNTWMREGWTALRKEQPEVIDLLRGRGKNLGSMLYTASESVGALTEHLSKSARAYRSGYGGALAYQEGTRIKQVTDRILHEAQSIDVDGKRYTTENFLRDTEAHLGMSLRKSRNTATPEQMETFGRYLDYFPHTLDTTKPSDIDAWFWEAGSVYLPDRGVVSAKAAREEGGDTLAAAEAKVADMHATADALNPQQRVQLQRMGRMWDNIRGEAAKRDAVVNDVRMGYEEANRLHPSQVSGWQGEGMNPALRDPDIFYVEPADATAAAYGNSHGIGEVHSTPSELGGTGVHVTTRPTSPDAIPVAIRGRHFSVIDHTAEAVTSDEAYIMAARQEAEAAMEQAAQAAGTVGGLYPEAGEALVRKDAQASASDMLADVLRKRDGSQGIITKHTDGSMDIDIFDWNDVKAVDVNAPQLLAERGYLHRTFGQDMKEWLRGTLSPTGRTVLVEAPHLETYLRRSTFGMTIDQAEDHVRRVLTERYGEEAVKTLPRNVWNRDVLAVHQEYMQWMAQGVTAEMVGAFSERMKVLGDLVPSLFSKGVRDDIYAWSLSPAMLRALKATDSKTTRAVLAAAERTARMTEELQRDQAKLSHETGRLFTDFEETLEYGLQSPDLLTSAIRGYGESAATAIQRVQALLARNAEKRARVQEQMEIWAKAEAKVAEDPLLGHPGRLDPMRTEDIGDGQQLIRGWQGRMDGVSPDVAYKGVDPEELSNGGGHVGTYQQAKDRIDTLVGLEEGVKRDGTIGTRTVGYRDDPSSWPTVEGTSTMPNPARGPGETMESHQHRLIDGGQFPTHDIKERAEVDQFGAMALQKAEGGSRNTDMAALRADVRANGVQEPIVIRINEDGSWSQLSGVHRLEAAEAEGIDSVPVKWVDDDMVEVDPPPMGSGATPVEPDLFYEDLIHPVEVRGRFHGAAEGEPIVGEGEMGPLSGSGRGATPEKTRARADYMDEGYDGLIYQNLAENGAPPGALGQSLVLFDPEGRIFEATGPKLLRQYADEGSLYVHEATGNVYTKKGMFAKGGKGFKKLPHIDRLNSTYEALAQDKADFERALRGIREGEAVGGQVFEGAQSPAIIEAAGRVGSNLERVAAREQARGFAVGRKYGRLRRDAMYSIGEMNRSIAEFKQVRAQMKPALVKLEQADLKGYTALKIPGLEGYAMPAYVAAEFHALVDANGIGALRQDWRRYVLGPWKRWATYRWPGFHVRNFFGAWFNGWLGGVTDTHMTFAWRVARAREGVEKWLKPISNEEFDAFRLEKMFGPAARGKATYEDFAEVMAERGVGHANTMSVYGIEGAIEGTKESYRAVGKTAPRALRRAARKYDDAMRYAGSSVEDFHRVAAFAKGMQVADGDMDGARAFVMMRHGDYSELTPSEDFIRDLVPFYKWMRTNVPYQIRMLAENPALLTLPDKLKSYAYDVQGRDRQEAELSQPDWMKQSMSIPIPDWVPFIGSQGPDGMKYAMFDLPYADLYNGLQDYMSSSLPVVRNVLESYGFNQTLFSGKPLSGKYEKLNGVFSLPGVSNMLEAAGLAKRGADGELYVQDKMQNVLMGWPVYSRFRNFVEGDPDRAANRLGGLFSMIGGVGIRQADFTDAELDFYYNEVEPLLEQYRSLGIQLPTVDEMQSAEVGAQLGLSDPQAQPIDQLFPSGQVA